MPNQMFFKAHITLFFLITANIVPVIGVLFFNWNLFQVFLVFWVETAIIGLFNIPKLIKVAGKASFVVVPFFVFHFGIFMAAHMAFIVALFGDDSGYESLFPPLSYLTENFPGGYLAIGMFFVSHGVSFYLNYIRGSGHNVKNDLVKQMAAPYARVMIMHLTVIFGGALVVMINAPFYALLVLILLKIILDIRAHMKEHALPLETQIEPAQI